MRKPAFLLLGLAVFAVDQASKLAVSEKLAPGDVVQLYPWFSLVHWRNTGGVWGSFQNLPTPWSYIVFLALPISGLAVLLYLFARSAERSELLLFSAILGAAAGNVLDRLRLGSVVDFLYFRWPGGPGWPAFNAADAVLSTCICVLLARALFYRGREAEDAPGTI